MNKLPELCKQIIDNYQHGFPLCPRPYAEMAATLQVSEQDILNALQYLNEQGILSRVGAVLDHRKNGASTLAALAVPDSDIENTAKLISSYNQVNHNYLRDNEVNLWFVLTADCQASLNGVIQDIEQRTGLSVLNFPMEMVYHIDLGFRKNWDDLEKHHTNLTSKVA